MRWVGRCQYHEGEGWVQLAWWPDLLPSLVGPKRQFTTYQLFRFLRRPLFHDASTALPLDLFLDPKGHNRAMPRTPPPTAKPLYWIGRSWRDMKDLPDKVQGTFGKALLGAQFGGKHGAVKSLRGFGGAGVRGVVEDDADGSRLYGEVRGHGDRPAWLPEKEQTRDRHAERGHGHHSCQVESGRGTGKGAGR